MNKAFRMAGFVACCVAVLAMCGGHWLALQSVAWGRMIVIFAQQDSLGTAIAKTFSGEHPCPLCLKVRNGLQQDRDRQDKLPWLKTEKLPEAMWQLSYATLPGAPTAPRNDQPFVPTLHTEFIDSPPAPPPRAS